MTEQEWLATTDLEDMFHMLSSRFNPLFKKEFLSYDQTPVTRFLCRKFQLFSVGCCRQVWDLFTDPNCRRALEVGEQYADRLVPGVEVLKVTGNVLGKTALLEARTLPEVQAKTARYAVLDYSGPCQFIPTPVQASGYTVEDISQLVYLSYPNDRETFMRYQRIMADVLRDVLGNPFTPTAFSPEWRTATAQSLARTMYDARDFSATSILADALQEAGCDSRDVLHHCRAADGLHTRGCWVLDLVLAEEVDWRSEGNAEAKK